VLPYCWRDETPLSNHELRMDDDVYQSRQDPAITVGFKIKDGGDEKELGGAFLLIWTTTPWTLPSNQAGRGAPGRRVHGGVAGGAPLSAGQRPAGRLHA
jgi:isoleucyl-tRNA synthetase